MPNIFSFLDTVILCRALFVAADLNIAEYLKNNNTSLEKLAKKTETHQQALKRLLYFLELHGVFIKDTTTGKYRNTQFSQTMCIDHPSSIKSFLLHDDTTRWNSFGHLSYSIKTGKSSFNMLYGKNYFEYLKEHPELNKRFDQAMTVISQEEDQKIAKIIPLKRIIADIGGGTGQLLTYIKEQNPDVQGILFKLSEVINIIKKNYFAKIAGSFFEPISIKADIFILKRIIHDWNDEKVLEILKNVHSAMNKNSELYIIDGILDHAQNKSLLAAIDLALLAIFEGRERTLEEMNDLLEKADLEIIEITPIDDLISAIRCKKL